MVLTNNVSLKDMEDGKGDKQRMVEKKIGKLVGLEEMEKSPPQCIFVILNINYK